jgi:hypothetical protein
MAQKTEPMRILLNNQLVLRSFCQKLPFLYKTHQNLEIRRLGSYFDAWIV